MLVELVDTVRARLEARGFDDVIVDEGLDARHAQNAADGASNRVVFIPSPQGGTFSPPLYIGEGENGRRQLFNMILPLEVVCTAFDPEHPERDLCHRVRCIDVFEVVVQEVHRVHHGLADWTGWRWEDPRKVGRHGAEIVASLSINIPLFDTPWELAIAKPATTKRMP